MVEQENWAIYAARLASFAVSILIPTKKRSSNAKGSKALSWPHKSPAPADLAKAGFYYKPSVDNPDNTLCFMCDRQLDGWEEEDDPVVEHLKHSEQCGWAILVNLAQDSHDPTMMEDPTKSRIADARRATFASGWPHETKRGWTCKIEKMVQAGWHFAPTPESDDFVSCTYCKLSLDGWEPKDNPFDEHHRRSPKCPFFSFAGTTAPKAGKGRKPRASKASRLSTQSNITVTSEVPSIPDLDESIDKSTVSVLSTASSMGKKKNARGKAKATRSKKAKPSFIAEPEISSIEVEVKSGPEKAARGKKRTSDQMSEYDRGEIGSMLKPEPAAKRRNTRSQKQAAVVAAQQEQTSPSIRSSPSAQSSDAENAPPSSRPEHTRPPLALISPNKIVRVQLAPGTPTTRAVSLSPSKMGGGLTSQIPWTSVDVDMVFANTPGKESVDVWAGGSLDTAEKGMTVEQWIYANAVRAEEDLRSEGERIVGVFEVEGQRAMEVLEGIQCI